MHFTSNPRDCLSNQLKNIKTKNPWKSSFSNFPLVSKRKTVENVAQATDIQGFIQK